MADITTIVQRDNVDLAFFTPSVARTRSLEQLPSLEKLIIVWEAVGRDNIERWYNNINLIIACGPAECSIQTSANSVTSERDRVDDLGTTGKFDGVEIRLANRVSVPALEVNHANVRQKLETPYWRSGRRGAS